MRQEQIYQMIEDKVISQLVNGIIPWRRTYNVELSCISHGTKQPYSLINQFMLDDPGEYWTFNQISKEGFRVKKGSTAKKIVFWDIVDFRTGKTNDAGEELYNHVPFLKVYNVFHERDVEGLPLKEKNGLSPEERAKRNEESIKLADEVIDTYLHANTDLSVTQAESIPCFIPSKNIIRIPEKCQFTNINEYYSTLFHEIIHSTKKYVGRPNVQSDEDRAREELVAEIGSAYLCGNVGIDNTDVFENNAAYCAGWLKALKNNIKMLVWASSRAEKAANYVLGKKRKENKECE